MVININSNRINIGTGGAGKAGPERRGQQNDAETIVVPKRAHVNFIPEPESLTTMIRSAIASLRQGKRWDRGTILNLLV